MVKTTTLLTILITIIVLLAIDHIRMWIQLKAAQDSIGYLKDSLDLLCQTLVECSKKYKQDVLNNKNERR